MIGMSMLLILVLVIGGTYAWFTLQLNGTKVNVLKAGTLSLILNDENSVGINSEKAVPMLDEVGETLVPYHFTLENHSDMPSDYTIYLDDLDLEENETRMNDSFVKYQLIKDGTKTTALLNTTGIHPNRVLDSGTISGNTTITYDLRLWIDENTGNEVMGTTLRTKIRVVATQSQQVVTPNENILNVYRYSEEDATKCIYGTETTCVELTERPNTYEAGTIVKYKVNDQEEKYFHVISDNGTTLTMQQQEYIASEVAWYSTENNNTYGPVTALERLEQETINWTNVKDQTYTSGVTTFKTNAFTGCSYDENGIVSCTANTYTLPQRTAKARMITVQEATELGCKVGVSGSCPRWMYQTLDDLVWCPSCRANYWMMSAASSDNTKAFVLWHNGSLDTEVTGQTKYYDAIAGVADQVGATMIYPVIIIDK